jgi:hypothetical protein
MRGGEGEEGRMGGGVRGAMHSRAPHQRRRARVYGHDQPVIQPEQHVAPATYVIYSPDTAAAVPLAHT